MPELVVVARPRLLAPPLPAPMEVAELLRCRMFEPYWLVFQGCSGIRPLMETVGVLLLGVVFQ